MTNKKLWSLMKVATSTIAAFSIVAVSSLVVSCVNNKNNTNNSQESNISIKNESPINQNISIDKNENLNLFVDATCNEGDVLNYQWYVNKDLENNNKWEIIPGATNSSHNLTNDDFKDIDSKETWKYKVEITSTQNPEDKIFSSEYLVNITPKKNDLPSSSPSKPISPNKPIQPPSQEPPSGDVNYNPDRVPTNLNFDYDRVNNSDPSSVQDIDFLYKEEITRRFERTSNVGYYQTDLINKYKNNGFKYPSYNYNYELGRNKFLNVNGNQVNVMKLVYEERVDFNGKQVKYNDENFIKNEIAKKELKAHPAAATWYEKNVSKDTKAVEKKFIIGPTKIGLYPLGLYAPAGEVITFTFDDETFELIKKYDYRGLSVVINDNYWDNYNENNSGRISNRYPFVCTYFSVDPASKSFKFGSPFGGNISVNISSFLSSVLNTYINPISFTVSGAVESLNYVHGYTTEDEWNRQIRDVEDGLITAPNMSAMYSWSSMNIPFTGPKIVAGIKVKDIVFPYDTFKKWNNFQFLSAYMSRRYSRMVSMKFCDDIWGNAAAWGGGYNLYSPILWAGSAFLSGVDRFNITNSWGLMHELNHTYQQDNTLFRRMHHNKTNQVTLGTLTLLSDTGLKRSETNIFQEGATSPATSGWTYLSNSFSNIQKLKNIGQSVGEYAVYGGLLFTMGGRNYIDYSRWAGVNHKNTDPGWTSLKEIQSLSNFIQVDLWPAFESVYNIWHDSWPRNYASANPSQKAIIDSLKKYSAVDFLGNLYACGSYLFNNATNQYKYTGDVNSPYIVPAYQDYVFDFENFINSSNSKFNWTKIIVNPKSKNGVPLEVVGKKLIYSASKIPYNDKVDEFDITIIPGNWEGKPSNYVPGYKWKIKVAQNIQDANVNLYTNVTNWNINSSNHADDVKKYSSFKSFNTRKIEDQTAYKVIGNDNLLRLRLSFIAPKTGKYIFNASWNDSIVVYANDNKVYSSVSSLASNKIYEKQMKVNEIISFDIFVYSQNNSCSFNLEVESNNKKIILENNLLGSNAYKEWYTLGRSLTSNMYRANQRFQYKPRFPDYLSFIQNWNNTIISNSEFVFPSKSLYNLKFVYSTGGWVDISRLYNTKTGNIEVWGSSTPSKLNFDVDFINPTKVGSLRFGHRTNHHFDARPTKIKVTGIEPSGKSIILYDGNYSSSISSRSDDSTIVNMNYTSVVKKLKIELTNTSYRGLILSWFSYSPEIYVPLNNNISVNDNFIAKTSGWSSISNNSNKYGALSVFGSSSLLTTTRNAAIDFNLKKSKGFKIVGTTTDKQSVVDIYIDNKIYKRNLKIGGTNKSYTELFKYIIPQEVDNLRVTIINKSNNPLIISLIQTFGNKGPVSTVPFSNKN